MLFIFAIATIMLIMGLSMYCLVSDSKFWGAAWFGIDVLLLLVFAWWLPDFQFIWTWVTSITWLQAVKFLAIYTVAGVGVSLLKWYFKQRDDAAGARKQIADANAVMTATDNEGIFKQWLDSHSLRSAFYSKPENDREAFVGDKAEFVASLLARPDLKVILARISCYSSLSRTSPLKLNMNDDMVRLVADPEQFQNAIIMKMSTWTDNIAVWIIVWPITLFAMLFEDIIIKVVREIISALRKVYDTLGKFAYRDIEK